MKTLPVRRAQFKLADFAAWLAANGAEIGIPTNPYEVIRYKAYAANGNKAATHIVYAKETGLLTFTGASREHYIQFANSSQMHPTADCNPFHVPKAVQRQVKKDAGTKSGGDVKRSKLLARDGDECWFCGLPMADDCTIEHLVPKSKGGGNRMDNYALAHGACNRQAADLPLVKKIELRASMRKEPA